LHEHYVVQKIQHFNRERVPERVVHAKGGARTASSRSPRTSPSTPRQAFSAGVGKRTPVFARFSQVAGGLGFPALSVIRASSR
jgi:catalase